VKTLNTKKNEKIVGYWLDYICGWTTFQ